MRKKRGAAVLLSLCLLIGLFAPARAMAQGEFSPVVLSLSSNLSSADRLEGYYRDQVFYVDVDDACGLAGMTIWSQSEKLVEISEGADEDDALRRMSIQVEKDTLTEYFYSGEQTVPMPAEVIGEEVCVSLFHFLTYMGVGYELDPEGDPQLTVVKWFDMLDLLHEYAASDRGNYFRWSEIDFNFGDVELNLTYQGVLALLGEESDPFQMIFHADDIYREDLEEDLLTVVANEGAEYLESETNPLKFADTVLSKSSSWYSFLQKSYKLDENGAFDKILKRLSSGKFFVSAASGMGGQVTGILDYAMQCGNMTDAQRNLLQETILKSGRSTDMVREEEFWEILVEAAEGVSTRVEDEIGRREERLVDTVFSTAYDAYEKYASGGTVFQGNVAMLVWNTVTGLFKISPAADQAREVHNAYNCSMIQQMGMEMVTDRLTDLYEHDFYHRDPERQAEAMRDLRYAVILQLKATLSAREAMVKSGAFQGIEGTYREKCRETAALLRRAENASLAGPKDSSACDLDLSWMEEYTSDGGDLYQLALENLEERESFSYIRRGRMSGDFSGFQELEFAESAEMTGYGTDKASGGGRYQQTGGSGAVDYTFTYAWPRLEKQYQDPYPGQETEERELVNFSLPFYSAVVRTEQGEDGTTVYTADYSRKILSDVNLGLLNCVLPDGYRIYWAPDGQEAAEGVERAVVTAVMDENYQFDSITVEYALYGGVQDVGRLEGVAEFVFDDKGAEAVELGEQREVAGTWLQQGEANPILLILGEDGSLTYYPTVTEENIYHSSFQVENDTLRLEMVNLDGSGVTSVPFAMEADPADERRMSIAVDRELAGSTQLLYGMDGILEGTYLRLQFTEGQLAELGRSQLMAPEQAQITWEQGEPYFWDGGACWLVPVRGYENGAFVAGADFNGETLEMCRSIYVYSGGQ